MADEELEVRAKVVADVGDFVDPMQSATASLQHFQKALAPSTKALTLLGASAGIAGYAIVRYGKEAFGVAAKVSELKVAIDAVGKSTGLGAAAINNAAKAIRKNGIEMDAAQNIALKFAQNNLDLSKAADVARVAQDLAVISQKNSTETAELLTRAIQTGSSILLKSAGISRYASEGYAKYAKTLGKNATQLTATERQQATINLIMEEGTRVAGLYEAAMTEPGKVLRSFKRIQNDIQLEMGNVLLKGFGPMIKAAYDLTKSFSESLREGGAFRTILQGMGIAFKDLLQPMTDLLLRGHRFFKDLQFGKQSADQIADSFKKFLPIVTSVGAALAALGGKRLLGGLPLVGGLFKSLNPFLTGLMLLAALSPKLRDSMTDIAASLKPMIPAVIALSKAFADTLAQVVDLATGMLDAFGPVLTTTLGGVASALKMVAGSLLYLKPVLMMVGLLLLKNFVVGAIMANTRIKSLIVSFKAMSVAVKTAIAEQKAYSLTASQGAAAITSFRAALYALKAGFVALRAAAVSLIASMLPLIAIYAGIQIFMAWRKEQQATEERTRELTQAVKDQLYAMKGDVKVINEFVQGQRDLATVLTSGSDSANELGQALQVIGADAHDAFAAFDGGAESISDFNMRMVKLSGIKFDSDELSALLTVVENTGGWALSDDLVERFGGLNARQKEFADNLKRVNDAMKTTDTAAYVKQNIEYLAGIDKLGKKAYDYAMAEVFKNEAVEGGIDTYKEAIILQELFADKYAKLAAKARAAKAETDKVTKAVDAQKISVFTLINRLDGLRDATDDNIVKAQAFAEAFYGQKAKQNETLAKFQQIREQTTELASSLESTKDNTDLFAKAGMSLFNQLTENSAAILTLGGNTADVVNYQKSAIEQFYKAADAAGWQKQQTDALLYSLGILQGLDKLTVQIDIDIENFKNKILVASKALALLQQGIGGDAEDARKAQSFISRMEQMVKQLEGTRKGAISGANSFDKFNKSTDKASKAASELEKKKEKLRRKIMEVAEKALAKATERMEEYADAMKGMTDAAKTAIYGSYSLTDALGAAEAAAEKANEPIRQMKQDMADYAKGVADSLKGTLSFSNALSGYEQTQDAIAKANEDVAAAQAKVNEEQALFDELIKKAETTAGRKARREAYEEAAKQLEKVTEAQRDLGDATAKANEAQKQQKSMLDRLREQYKNAINFSSQLQELVAKGLGREGVDQLLAMGAETGGKFATELLSGSADAIPEVNKMFQELGKESEKAGQVLGKAYFKIGDEVAIDFFAALAQQAHKASQFAETVKRLVAMGLSPNNIRMVLEAGVEAGSKIAAAIELGGADTIRQMNQFEESLRGQAENLGTYLNDTFYKSGYELAKQIVKGIKDKIELLEEEIADATLEELQKIFERVKGEFDAMIAGLPIPVKNVVNPNPPADSPKPDSSTPDSPKPDSPKPDAGATPVTMPVQLPVSPVFTPAEVAVAVKNLEAAGMNAATVTKIIEQNIGNPLVAGGIPDYMRVIQEQTAKAATVIAGGGGGGVGGSLYEAVMMAKGGIVTGPTLGVVGEAGPEAVIPLSRLGKMGESTVINLTVNAGMGADGRSIGDAIVNELKRWSRKNGAVPVQTV